MLHSAFCFMWTLIVFKHIFFYLFVLLLPSFICLCPLVSLCGLLFCSLSLSLCYFSVSLCQLQRCPTYRCLPSLHLTACLKKINISAGKEAKASVWCVYLCSSRVWTYCKNTVVPRFWPLLLFIPLNPCNRDKKKPDVSVIRLEGKSQAMIPLNKALIFQTD